MAAKIAAVIPSYKVRRQILDVITNIGSEVERIFVIDDCCPEHSGNFVQANCSDPRVNVIRNDQNQGVGGAVITGYLAAISEDMDIIVKIDGDGQMDPRLIPRFVAPILKGQADYTKGNRFYDLRNISRMPTARLFGNAVLSFLSKLSTGYWNLFDPTNGSAIPGEGRKVSSLIGKSVKR
jgi:glycosyltransferase involved in cell wall biosynthesis